MPDDPILDHQPNDEPADSVESGDLTTDEPTDGGSDHEGADDEPAESDDPTGHEPTTTDPRRSRPETEASYGIPTEKEGMLPWEFVVETLTVDRTYWVATTLPNGRPHTRPVWGVWVDDTFHCGGGERTRWVRNLAREPAITIHRESGKEVVVVEGETEKLTEETASADRLERIDAAYEAKYGTPHGTPVFAVRPERVFAWRDYPTDATRWTFEDDRR